LVRFLLAELMIGTSRTRWPSIFWIEFQSPISGVNDWNMSLKEILKCKPRCFSLLLAELMIGTWSMAHYDVDHAWFQSPISGVNDWNPAYSVRSVPLFVSFQSPISGVNDWNQKMVCA